MACLVDGCWRTAHRLLTADPTFSATSETFSFASFATSPTNVPAECPAPLSLIPIYQHLDMSYNKDDLREFIDNGHRGHAESILNT